MRQCTWCKSSALTSGCFHEREAKLLPSGVYDCKDKRMAQKGNHKLPTQKADAPTADPCEKLDKAACKDNKQCVWCISSAVPSSCYTVAQAKFLPPAVFQCDIKPDRLQLRRNAANMRNINKKTRPAS
eukprot:jgi/Chrzof1/2653/Cz11g24010.t1